jgi:hypothetical protein
MSELLFERGLFATLAAALIVPELTTFLIFVFVALSVATLAARQAWFFVRLPVAARREGLSSGSGSCGQPSFRIIADPLVPPGE